MSAGVRGSPSPWSTTLPRPSSAVSNGWWPVTRSCSPTPDTRSASSRVEGERQDPRVRFVEVPLIDPRHPTIARLAAGPRRRPGARGVHGGGWRDRGPPRRGARRGRCRGRPQRVLAQPEPGPDRCPTRGAGSPRLSPADPLAPRPCLGIRGAPAGAAPGLALGPPANRLAGGGPGRGVRTAEGGAGGAHRDPARRDHGGAERRRRRADAEARAPHDGAHGPLGPLRRRAAAAHGFADHAPEERGARAPGRGRDARSRPARGPHRHRSCRPAPDPPVGRTCSSSGRSATSWHSTITRGSCRRISTRRCPTGWSSTSTAWRTLSFMPSFDEGFGLPILEAAINRLPIVCTGLPVFRDAGRRCRALHRGGRRPGPDRDEAPPAASTPTDAAVSRGTCGRSYAWEAVFRERIAPLFAPG